MCTIDSCTVYGVKLSINVLQKWTLTHQPYFERIWDDIIRWQKALTPCTPIQHTTISEWYRNSIYTLYIFRTKLLIRKNICQQPVLFFLSCFFPLFHCVHELSLNCYIVFHLDKRHTSLLLYDWNVQTISKFVHIPFWSRNGKTLKNNRYFQFVYCFQF